MTTATAFNQITQHATEQDPAQEQQPEYMGRYYIRDAVPLKGMNREDGGISADGKTFYLLQCFPIAGDPTPGQVREMEFTDDHAHYMVYYGHMSRFKGDPGMVVGYVDQCFGKKMDYPNDGDIQQRVVTDSRSTMYPRPQVRRDIDKPYGRHQHRVAGFDETIAIMNNIDRARAKPAPARKAGLRCLGG